MSYVASPVHETASPSIRRSRGYFDPDEYATTRANRASSQPPRHHDQKRDSSISSIDLQRRLEHSVTSSGGGGAADARSPTSSTTGHWPPIIARPGGIPTTSRSVSFSESSSFMTGAGEGHHHHHHHHHRFASSSSNDEDDEESEIGNSSLPAAFDDSGDDSNDPYDYRTPRRKDSNPTPTEANSKRLPASSVSSEHRPRLNSSASSSSSAASFGLTQGGINFASPPPSARLVNSAFAPTRIDTTNLDSSYDRSGYRPSLADDHTNMSPFVRDLSQINAIDQQLYLGGTGNGTLGGGSNASSTTTARRLGLGAHNYGGFSAGGAFAPSSFAGVFGSGASNGSGANGHSSHSSFWPSSLAREVGRGGMRQDDNAQSNGGASGTTSRRHSVSVVGPRRAIAAVSGFDAISPGSFGGGHAEPPSPISAVSEVHDAVWRNSRQGGSHSNGGRGAMFSDEELAGSLGMLSMDTMREREQRRGGRDMSGYSQPSSLPTTAGSYGPPRSPVVDSLRAHMDHVNNGSPASSHAGGPGAIGRELDGVRRSTSSRSSGWASDRDTSSSPERDMTRSSRNGLHHSMGSESFSGAARGSDGNVIPTFRATDALKSSAFGLGVFDNPSGSLNASSPTLSKNMNGGSIGLNTSFGSSGNNFQTSSISQRGPMSPILPQEIGPFSQQSGFNPVSSRSPPQPSLVHSRHPSYQGSNYGGGGGMASHMMMGGMAGAPGPGVGSLNDASLGRGVPLYQIPRDAPLFIIEFKAGRNDIFYVADPASFYGRGGGELKSGDLVIVEADRGRDLGRVTRGNISPADVETWHRQRAEQAAIISLQQQHTDSMQDGGNKPLKELMPKKIYSRATHDDLDHLAAKASDEQKALALCQGKIRMKKLPMEVVDAEYQWDRRKLTFYYVSEQRIDFRELVRELFRLYKTRIWMSCLQGPTAEQ